MALSAPRLVGQADITYIVTKVHVPVCTNMSPQKNERAQHLRECRAKFRDILESFPEEVRSEMRSEGRIGVNPTEIKIEGRWHRGIRWDPYNDGGATQSWQEKLTARWQLGGKLIKRSQDSK